MHGRARRLKLKFVFGKFVRHVKNATPPARKSLDERRTARDHLAPAEACLDQSKHDFNGDPNRDRTTGGVMRGNEFPSADGLHGTVVEAHADSLNDLDLLRAAIRTDESSQRNLPLQLGLARFVRVGRIRAVPADGERDTGPVTCVRAPYASRPVDRSVPHGIPIAVANGVGVTSSG